MLHSGLVELPSLSEVAPFLEQIGFGAAAGFVVGFALKKIGKLVALLLGVLFVVLQLLAYFGYVTIEWGRIQGQVEPLLEADSLGQAWRGLLGMLTYNLPFASAFVPAFVLGLKRG